MTNWLNFNNFHSRLWSEQHRKCELYCKGVQWSWVLWSGYLITLSIISILQSASLHQAATRPLGDFFTCNFPAIKKTNDSVSLNPNNSANLKPSILLNWSYDWKGAEAFLGKLVFSVCILLDATIYFWRISIIIRTHIYSIYIIIIVVGISSFRSSAVLTVNLNNSSTTSIIATRWKISNEKFSLYTQNDCNPFHTLIYLKILKNILILRELRELFSQFPTNKLFRFF